MNTYPSTADMLRVVKNEVLRNIAPTMTTEEGQLSVGLVLMALSVLEARTGSVRDLLQKHDEVVTALLSKTGGTRESTQSPAQQPSALDTESEARLVAEAVEAAILNKTCDDAIVSHEIEHAKALFKALLAAEVPPGEPPALQPVITADLFATYLRSKFPDRPSMSVQSVNEVGGGFSKKTYRVHVRNGPEGVDEIIIRQNMNGGAIHSNVADEVPVIRAAHAAGLPVPAVFWSEENPGPLRAGFIAMEALPGRCGIEEWLIHPSGSEKRMPGEVLAEYMARLHAIPVQDLVPGENTTSVEAMVRKHIESHETRWLRERFQAEPLMRYAFEWLKSNIPSGIERLTVIHSDISERNILLKDGRITGILDWELWHVGDPNEDIAYVRPFIERIMSWPRFLEIYHAAGGPAYREENGLFWGVWAPLRILTYQSTGVRAFQDGVNGATKMITPLTRYNYYFLEELARALEAVRSNVRCKERS